MDSGDVREKIISWWQPPPPAEHVVLTRQGDLSPLPGMLPWPARSAQFHRSGPDTVTNWPQNTATTIKGKLFYSVVILLSKAGSFSWANTELTDFPVQVELLATIRFCILIIMYLFLPGSSEKQIHRDPALTLKRYEFLTLNLKFY